MVALLLVRQEISVSGSEPSKQTFRVKNFGQIGETLAVVAEFLLVSFGFISTSTAQGERGIGPGFAFVDPFTEGFVPSVVGNYSPFGPSLQSWNGSAWESIPSMDAPLSGIPSMPGQLNFAPWEVQGIEAELSGYYAPFVRLIPGSGSAPDVDLPDAATFVTDLNGHGEFVAQNAISSPLPAPFGGDVPLWVTFNAVPAQKSTFTLAMGGLTASYLGRNYTAIATRVTGQEEFGTGTLDVLLESGGTPPLAPSVAKFSVLTGNFLQVIDLIGPAPLPVDSGLAGGPDDRRERAIGKLQEFD